MTRTRCKHCDQKDHDTIGCPKKGCKHCGDRGHDAKDCQFHVCENCGTSGHHQNVCPEIFREELLDISNKIVQRIQSKDAERLRKSVKDLKTFIRRQHEAAHWHHLHYKGDHILLLFEEWRIQADELCASVNKLMIRQLEQGISSDEDNDDQMEEFDDEMLMHDANIQPKEVYTKHVEVSMVYVQQGDCQSHEWYDIHQLSNKEEQVGGEVEDAQEDKGKKSQVESLGATNLPTKTPYEKDVMDGPLTLSEEGDNALSSQIVCPKIIQDEGGECLEIVG